MTTRREQLRELYFGDSDRAVRFQGRWLLFDLAILVFFAVSPFMDRTWVFWLADYSIAAILLVDLSLRCWAFGDVRRWFLRPIVWADVTVLASLLVPVLAANFGFLRILRLVSLVNDESFWRVFAKGRWAESDFSSAAKATLNLIAFIFMMAALVHTSFAARVPQITSFMDSLYFTVTTLTTTGYGDIVLPGFWGKAISIAIMIGGVSLFFRLVQVLMRAPKVRLPCPACGLLRHEVDAVHCKACGASIMIPHDND